MNRMQDKLKASISPVKPEEVAAATPAAPAAKPSPRGARTAKPTAATKPAPGKTDAAKRPAATPPMSVWPD